ncbi:MAG: thymidine phosphorylase, partial [Ignavibacteria bacterium]|nr:thymidine phosphorylase [Ignavibacteria bacterium]
KAYEKFLQLVKKQNGDVSFIENVEKYSKSKFAVEVVAKENGFVTTIDSLELGLTSISLGAGRMKVDDVIDMKAGIMLKKKVGDEIKHNEVLATFYTDNSSVLDSAKERIQKAFTIGMEKPKKEKLIRAIVDEKGVREF